jgi:hypothetical protein
MMRRLLAVAVLVGFLGPLIGCGNPAPPTPAPAPAPAPTPNSSGASTSTDG